MIDQLGPYGEIGVKERSIEGIVAEEGLYPEDEDLQKFVNKRNRRGRYWYIIFIASTIVAIVALGG